MLNPQARFFDPDFQILGFSFEALAKILTSSGGRFDKDFIGNAIRNDLSIPKGYLSLSYSAISRHIPSRVALKGHEIVNRYTSFVNALKHLGVSLHVSTRKSLYGYSWRSDRVQIQRLRVEAYGIDWVTGFYTKNGARHHIEYDKSKSDDYYQIYTDSYINLRIIRNPPRQNYFGEPIEHDPQTLEWMRLGRMAKEAFGRGEHNPMWLDQNSPWYHPNAARRFYWGKLMVSKHGPQWLDTPLATFSPPPWFLSHLKSNPRNIQPPP